MERPQHQQRPTGSPSRAAESCWDPRGRGDHRRLGRGGLRVRALRGRHRPARLSRV